ncbi:hypothetical protein NE236_38590 [Actinoallomurus purpureus]|uniref:hypothetical protein n=1 Tax=Actinoallomurus purpureus TaxID=478114 RepID=UPI0020933EBA|nr:hypothetical protein [Actinoallomurus purpureus]MCO6010882.1 hypothetical protein [Actinoallomurus purpureus]
MPRSCASDARKVVIRREASGVPPAEQPETGRHPGRPPGKGGAVNRHEDLCVVVVGDASDGGQAVDAAFRLRPDVVVVDVRAARGQGERGPGPVPP